MADLAELERKVRALEDIEAIKRLKYKYLRCLDLKLWDELAECFTPDATTDYADGELHFEGVEAIMKFLRESLGPETGIIDVHHCHHPEIELTSETTATGTWAMWNYLIGKPINWGFRMAAHYHDQYVKVDGQWKIRSTGYKRIFQEEWERTDSPSLKLVVG